MTIEVVKLTSSITSAEMTKLRLVLVVLMCAYCTGAVDLNVWFLIDIEFDVGKSLNVLEVAPETIWRNLKRSDLLRGHLANSYTVANGLCNLEGTRKVMKDFTPDKVNSVHGFIGPICSYQCDLIGLISSAYSIPQVCASSILIRAV